jgi:DNA-binding NtrC family response regulator
MKNRILLVDDEVHITELLGKYLAGKGYRIAAATSAVEALRTVKREPPDLVIADLQLEESDGMELIKQLKVLLPHTPVILLTGVHFDARVVRQTLSQSVSSYLEKTATLARILEEVRRLLGEPPA